MIYPGKSCGAHDRCFLDSISLYASAKKREQTNHTEQERLITHEINGVYQYHLKRYRLLSLFPCFPYLCHITDSDLTAISHNGSLEKQGIIQQFFLYIMREILEVASFIFLALPVY